MSTNSQYADLIRATLAGDTITTRNSTVKRRVGQQVTFSSTPLVSSRKTAWRSALREMEWFLSGSCNINDLHPSVHPWWQPWADAAGNVCNNYSVQFRAFLGVSGTPVDQIDLLVNGVTSHPYSRRNVITTWNTADMVDGITPITNCHGTVIQAFVDSQNRLDLIMYQRSVDLICGLPHNWIQYWAFLQWLAHRGGRQVGRFIWTGGDIHIYGEHLDLAQRILATGEVAQPELVYTPTSDTFKADDFTLSGPYEPAITEKAVMVV